MHTVRIFMSILALAVFVPGSAHAQEDIAGRLANAEAENGEKIFRKCKACHTIEEGGANRVGPNLYGIVNRQVAGDAEFRYSPAMQEHGGTWTVVWLDEYLENPRKAVKGTKMSFAGIKDAQDRADLIAYLNINGDEPEEFEAADQVEETVE